VTRRRLRRAADGVLTDEDSGQAVSLAQVRDDLRDGRRFSVRRADGSDATFAVLAEVVTGREPGPPSAGGRGAGGIGDAVGRTLREALEGADAGRGRRRPRRAEDP
jgi:hypothetical protein